MPVSDQRLAQIFALSNGERGDAEMLAFCRETTDPEELHAFADTWNWTRAHGRSKRSSATRPARRQRR
jgi:hypothetical protein